MKFGLCKTSSNKRTSKIIAAKSVVRRSIKILNSKQERNPTKQGKYHSNCLQSELETINYFTKQKVVLPQITTTPNKRTPITSSLKTPQTLPKPKTNPSKPTNTKFTRSQTPNPKSQQQSQSTVTPLKRQQPVSKAPNTINVLTKTPSAYTRRQANIHEKQEKLQEKTPSKPHKSLIPTTKSQSSIKKPVTASNTPLNAAKRTLYASNNAISEHKKPTKLTQFTKNIRRSLGFLKKCSSKEQLAVPLPTSSSQSKLPIPVKATTTTNAFSKIPLRIGSTQSLNTMKPDDTMMQLEQLINKHEENSDEIMVAMPLSSLKRIINTPKGTTDQTKSKIVVNMECGDDDDDGDENANIENDLKNSKQIEIMNKSGSIKVSESSAKSEQIPKFFLKQHQPKTIQHNLDEIVSPFSMKSLFKPKTPQQTQSILANSENLTPVGLKRLLNTPKQNEQEGDKADDLHAMNNLQNNKRQQIGSNLLEAISPASFNCMYEIGSSPAATYKKPPFYKQFFTPNNNASQKLKIFGDRQSTSKKATSKYISPFVIEDVRLLAGSEEQFSGSDLIKFDIDSLESTNDNLSQLELLCSQKLDGSQRVDTQLDLNTEEAIHVDQQTPKIYCVDREFMDTITSTVISLQNKVVELEEKVSAGSQQTKESQVEDREKLSAIEVVCNKETLENGELERMEVTSGEQIVSITQEAEIAVLNNEIVNESIETGSQQKKESQVEINEKLSAIEVVCNKETTENGELERMEVTSGEQTVSVAQEAEIVASNNEIVNESINNDEKEVRIEVDAAEKIENETDVGINVIAKNGEQITISNDENHQLPENAVSPFPIKNGKKGPKNNNTENLTPIGMKRLLRTPRTRKQHRDSIVDSTAIQTLFQEQANDQVKETREKPTTQTIIDEKRPQEPVLSENIEEKRQKIDKKIKSTQENVSPFAMKNLFKNKLAPGTSGNKETLTPVGMKRLLNTPRTRKQHRDSIVDSTAIETLFQEEAKETREIPTIQITVDDTNSQETVINDEKRPQEPIISEFIEEKSHQNKSAQENVSPFAMMNPSKNKLTPEVNTNKETLTPVGMKRLLRTPRTRKQQRESIEPTAMDNLFKENEIPAAQTNNEDPVANAIEQQEIINDTIEEDDHVEGVVSHGQAVETKEEVLDDQVLVEKPIESIEMSVSSDNKQPENEQITIKIENKLADECISPFAMKNLFKGKKGQPANAENLTPVGMKRLLRTPRTRKQHHDSIIDSSAIETLFQQQDTATTTTNEKPIAPIVAVSDTNKNEENKQIAPLKKQLSDEATVSPFAMKNLFKHKLEPGTTNTSKETLTPVGMKRLLRTPRARKQQQQRDSVEPTAIDNLFKSEETTEQTKPPSSSQSIDTKNEENLNKSMESSEFELISQSSVASKLIKETYYVSSLLTANDLLERSSQISLPSSLTGESIDRLLTKDVLLSEGNLGVSEGVTPSASTELRQINENKVNIIEIESSEALCQVSNALMGDEDDEDMEISYVEVKNQSVSPMDVEENECIKRTSVGQLPMDSEQQQTIGETDSNVKATSEHTMHTPTTPLLKSKVQVHLNLVNDACTNNNSITMMLVDNTIITSNTVHTPHNNNNNNKVEEEQEEEEHNVDDFIRINNNTTNNNSNSNINSNNSSNININNNNKKKMVDTNDNNNQTKTDNNVPSSNGVTSTKIEQLNNELNNKHKSSENGSSLNLESSKQQNDDSTNGAINNNNNNGCLKIDEDKSNDSTKAIKSNEDDKSAATNVAAHENSKKDESKESGNKIVENNKMAVVDQKKSDDVVDVASKCVEHATATTAVSETSQEKKEPVVVEEKAKEEEPVKTTRRNARGKQAAAAAPVVDVTDSGVEAKSTRSRRNQKATKTGNEKEQEQRQSSQEEEKVENVKTTTASVEKQPDEVVKETQEKKVEVEETVAQKEEAKPVKTTTSEEKPVEEEAKVEVAVEETKKPGRGGKAKAAPRGKKGAQQKQVEETTTTTTVETTAAAAVTTKEPEVVVVEEKKKEEEKVKVAVVETEEKEVEEKPKGKKAPAKKTPARGRGKAAAAAKEEAAVEETKEEETKKEAEPEAKVEEKKEEETPKKEEKKEEKVAEAEKVEEEEEETTKTKAAPKGRGGARGKKVTTTTTTVEVTEVEQEKPSGRVTRSRQVKFVEEVKEPETKKPVTPAKGRSTKRKAEPEPVEPTEPTVEPETTKKDEEQATATITNSAAKRRATAKKQKEPEPEVEEKKVVEEKPVEEEPVKKSDKKQAEPDTPTVTETQKSTAKKGGRGASKRKVSVDTNESATLETPTTTTTDETSGGKRVTRAQSKRTRK